jgi:transcriptional regulator with XRE-family HTH domain
MCVMTYDEAIAWAGGKQADLAAKLGLTQGAVSQWRRKLPDYMQFRIEVCSGGALKVDPAILPPELRQP